MGKRNKANTLDSENIFAFDMTSQEAIVKKEIHIVGQHVKYYRERRGMEQMALAKMLGVKSNAISNWEHGRTRPDLNQIPKICAALEIGFYELFGVDDPMRTFTEKERAMIEDYRYLSDQNKSVLNAVLSTLVERQRAESLSTDHQTHQVSEAACRRFRYFFGF